MDSTNTIADLVSQLKVVLTARNFDTYSDDYLTYEINQAIAAINRCRRFVPTEDKLYDTKYEHLIIPLCVSAIAKIGAEGELSHSENGVSRTYTSANDYPKDLLQQIIPLIK